MEIWYGSSTRNSAVYNQTKLVINNFYSLINAGAVNMFDIHYSINLIMIELKKLDFLANSFNEIKESMTFCSYKTNDFLIKFDSLDAKVNKHSK